MSPDNEPSKAPGDELIAPEAGKLVKMLEYLVAHIPASSEIASDDPDERAKRIVSGAAAKAGAMSAGLALPIGPAGMLTILPDLMNVWKIQRQMVSDIAACYGKTAQLDQRMMVFCLFRHGAAMLARDILVRVGGRLILKRGSLRVIQKVLQRVAIKVTQRTISQSISRWVPLVGPIVVGGYSLLDTRSVGKTAWSTFRYEIEEEPENSPDRHQRLR